MHEVFEGSTEGPSGVHEPVVAAELADLELEAFDAVLVADGRDADEARALHLLQLDIGEASNKLKVKKMECN